MEFKDILSISGYSGLHKMLKQAKTGLIIESLVDGKRQMINSTNKISSLEDISVYTETDEKPLRDVLKLIFEKNEGKETISHKSDATKLKNFFAEVLEDYDRDRVYVSDIKRIINWYNILIKHDLSEIIKKSEEEQKKLEEKAEEVIENKEPEKKKESSK